MSKDCIYNYENPNKKGAWCEWFAKMQSYEFLNSCARELLLH